MSSKKWRQRLNAKSRTKPESCSLQSVHWPTCFTLRPLRSSLARHTEKAPNNFSPLGGGGWHCAQATLCMRKFMPLASVWYSRCLTCMAISAVRVWHGDHKLGRAVQVVGPWLVQPSGRRLTIFKTGAHSSYWWLEPQNNMRVSRSMSRGRARIPTACALSFTSLGRSTASGVDSAVSPSGGRTLAAPPAPRL